MPPRAFGTTHNDLVRRAFTTQAAAYAANPAIADPERVARLVRTVEPAPDSRVLEVATGPGYVALGFAAACREVVGVDLTDAPLAIAEQNRQARGLTNVRFERGDAQRLAYADASFDVVVCRLAFHHFADPAAVLAEMARVCRGGGKVAVEDIVVSELPERAAYQNRFENLRDPSHTRAFPLGALLGLFTAAGVEVEDVHTGRLVQVVERWLAVAHTPPDVAAQVRALIEADALRSLSGTYPHDGAEGLTFVQRTAIVVGRRASA
jgi:SAM-dependent methyltransferase